MITTKELSDLYRWIRKNNQHTPDEIVDYMYEAAKEKLDKLNPTHCYRCDGRGLIKHRHTFEEIECPDCDGRRKI